MAAIMQIAGSSLNAIGTIAGGRQAEKMGRLEKEQAFDNALKTEAVSQREAISERRSGKIAKSRAKAVMAASGLSSTDTGALNIQNEIEAQSEYNAMAALYSGYDQAQKQRDQGVMSEWEGKQAKKASYINAASTILGSGSSMYERYGKK